MSLWSFIGAALLGGCNGPGGGPPNGALPAGDSGTERPLPRGDSGMDDTGPPDTGPGVPGRPWQGPVDIIQADGIIVAEPALPKADGSGMCDLPNMVPFPRAVPDVTGDGVPDLMYEVLDSCAEEPYLLRVFSGLSDSWSASDEAAADIVPTDVEGDNTYITHLNNVGDVDGDGYSDVVAGRFYATGSQVANEGEISLMSGPLVGQAVMGDLTSAWMFSKLPGRSNIATSSVSLGDQDGDGYGDFALGSAINVWFWDPFTDPFVQSTAWILHGPVTGTGTLREAPLEEVNYAHVDMAVGDQVNTGARVGSGGDQNGDGIVDLAIGSPNFPLVAPGSGAVVILYGPIPPGPLTWEDYDALIGDAGSGKAYSYFGYTVTGDLDMDGDGQDDLVVGSSFHSESPCNSRYSCGAAFVVPGPLSGDMHVREVGTARVVGVRTEGMLGSSLAALGDIDGDGRDDAAAGAYGDHHVTHGTVSVLYGGIEGVHLQHTDGTDPDTALLYSGDEDSSYVGDQLSGGQDLNQDGWPDLVITDPRYEWSYARDISGRYHVLWGGPR